MATTQASSSRRRTAVDTLLRALDERFRRHLDTAVENPAYGLTFVHDDESYVCYRNCNHRVVLWLRELGCEVRGCAGFSNFRVAER